MVDDGCDRISLVRVLVYGDYIIDKYSRVVTTRDCPERAGAPVYDILSSEEFLGCAGNVWRNVLALSMVFPDLDVYVGGGLGPYAEFMLLNQAKSAGVGISSSLRAAEEDIWKERLVSDGRVLCRIDSSRKFSFPVLQLVDDAAYNGSFDLLIVADYCFGSIDEFEVRELIAESRVSIVDTKRQDLSIFEGATAFKFNKGEYTRHVGTNIPSKWVVVSQGERGCRVIDGGTEQVPIAAAAAWDDVEEVDVTGCGDTFTAALGLYLAGGHGIDRAAYAANYLASRVVTRLGPSVPSPDEIEEGKKRGVL